MLLFLGVKGKLWGKGKIEVRGKVLKEQGSVVSFPHRSLAQSQGLLGKAEVLYIFKGYGKTF